jgi:hypothetical protein
MLMKTILLLPLAMVAASCAVAIGDEAGPPSAADEAAMSAALAGRTAGEPVACVRRQDVRNSRGIGNNTILFDGPGNILYVNRTASSCPTIRPWHALRQRSIGSSMCSNDLIRVFDPQTGVEYGACSLGRFTPYRRSG